MEIEDDGLPIKRDAKLKIRSRIFLEGNYFVELQPGSPPRRELESGDTLPPTQASAPVQFDQVLTALQSDTREDLQRLPRRVLEGARGPGARGFNQAIEHWEAAYRNTPRRPRPTSARTSTTSTRLLEGQGSVFGALSRDEQALEDLVTYLNLTCRGFARQEDNLRATIPALRDVLRVGRPALTSLNGALPDPRVRARRAPRRALVAPTLDAQIPFIKQARALVSEDELRGLAADLRDACPDSPA